MMDEVVVYATISEKYPKVSLSLVKFQSDKQISVSDESKCQCEFNGYIIQA